MVERSVSGGAATGGWGGFALHVLRGRWLSIFATFLIMTGSSCTYLFGIYSKDMKTTLGYDQTTVNLIGFFKDLGANVGVLSGLIAEVTPTWFVLLVGAAMNFAGYFMVWLAVTGGIPKPRVWQLCLYIFIGANSQNFANTGALVTCVKNFPENRGVVLGLLKGFIGLGGGMFTQLYLAIYGNDSKSLILLIAWLPAAISVIFVYTVREIKAVRQPNEIRVFYHFLYVSIFLAVFLMIMTLLQKQINFSPAAYAASASVVCIILFVPLLIVIKEELVLWRKTQQPVEHPSEISISKPQEQLQQQKPDPETSFFSNIFNKPDRGEDYTILQALLSIDMGILFLATMFGLGSSLAAVDNLGQIGESLGYPQKTVSTFVSLVSIWNYFGRVFAGFVSDTLYIRFKTPRPLLMAFVLVLSSVGHLLIAFPAPESVFVASIIIGFSFGAQFPLALAIISELFGLKYYSTLFNCGILSSPLGSYILNVKITGMLYDNEALKQLKMRGLDRSAVKELTCIGNQCYRSSFIILAAGSLFGALVSLILVVRTKEFYKGDIYKKFRNDVKDVETEKSSESAKERR